MWVAGFLLCIVAFLMSSGIALQLSWEIAGFTPIPVFIESRQILLPIIYPPQLHFKSMAASRKALLMVFLGLLVFKSNSLTAKSLYDAQLHMWPKNTQLPTNENMKTCKTRRNVTHLLDSV